MWAESLKEFSLGEVNQAFIDLLKHPPKYEIGGEIQVWRGLPKLPDVIQVMLENRERSAEQARRREGERLAAEMKELAKEREKHPENFVGMADVLAGFKEKFPEIETAPDRNGAQVPVKSMPNVHEMTDLEWAQRQEHLRQQGERLIKSQHKGGSEVENK